MIRLLLDTNALIWLSEGKSQLGKTARAAIENALEKQSAFISAVSFYELGWLVARKRIALAKPIDFWRSDVLRMGFMELPLTGDVALLATQLEWDHPDPADRQIIAATISSGCVLLTSDQRILGWDNPLKRHDARI